MRYIFILLFLTSSFTVFAQDETPETEKKLIKHQSLMHPNQRTPNSVEQSANQSYDDQLFEKDRIKNPTLALISDHLWWLALMAKISIIFMLLTIVSILL